MTPAQWRQYADQWKQAGPELDRVRREELKNWKYDWRIVDALLEIGAKSPHKEDEPNGLVEMQRWFMKAARKQGRLPYVVRETPGASLFVEKVVQASRLPVLISHPGRLHHIYTLSAIRLSLTVRRLPCSVPSSAPAS